MRTTHQVLPNTPEWEALRMTFNGTASEAPIMMGLSSNVSRDALIKEKAEGIKGEVGYFLQKLYDSGHENERLARPLAEDIIGETLYPTTVSDTVEGLHLGASLDGETLDSEIIWEHKQLNIKLAESVPKGDLDLEYAVQMEQQFMLSGAEICLFMASKDGDEKTMVHLWYSPVKELQKRIILEWKQFWIDVGNYKAEVEVIKPVANAVTELPMVSVSVTGQIAIVDNFDLFEVALHDFIDNRLITDPETDQDFADLDLQIKAMKNAEAALNASEKAIIAQIPTVEEKQRIKNMLFELTRSNRLASEKLLKQKNDSIRLAVLNDTNAAFSEHMKGLNTRLGGDYMPPVNINVAGSIKGKRTISSLKGAANNELARAKIDANAIADTIQMNLTAFERECGDEYRFLFRDLTAMVKHDLPDFMLIVTSRISEHKLGQERKLEAERERIRAEEQAKAEADQRRKAEKEQAERDRIERKKRYEETQFEREKEVIKDKAGQPEKDHEWSGIRKVKTQQPEGIRSVTVGDEEIPIMENGAVTENEIMQSLIKNGIGKTTAKKVAGLLFKGKIEGVILV